MSAGIQVALLTVALGDVASPENPGSFATTTKSVVVGVARDVEVDTDVYLPIGEGPFPVAVLRHGYLTLPETLGDFGPHLASHGILTLVPERRNYFDDDPLVEAEDLLAVLDWALAQNVLPGALLHGKVDSRLQAVGGFSSGGLAALIAAARRPDLSGLLLLDHEGSPLGDKTAGSVMVPTAALFADPGWCNEFGGGVSAFRRLAGPRFGLHIQKSSHCDAQLAHSFLCGIACGGVTEIAEAAFRRYATAFLLAYLRCEPSAWAFLTERAAFDGAVSVLPETRGIAVPERCLSSHPSVPTNLLPQVR